MESRILTIQRRHMPAFRIRLGEFSGGRPQSLVNEIRITSRNRSVCDAFAEVFGGKSKRWSTGGRKEYEVYLPTNELPVEVLPGEACTQYMEFWQGGVCQRRCDGLQMQDGKECVCGPAAPVTERECKPVTRLSLIVPPVRVLGSGMLTTRSVIAAETLPQQVDLALKALTAGVRVPHKLRVAQAKGAGTRYIYPVLEPDRSEYTLGSLMAGELDAPEQPALEAPKLVRAPDDWMERAKALSTGDRRRLNDERKAASLPSLTEAMTADQLAAYGDILDSIAPVDVEVL